MSQIARVTPDGVLSIEPISYSVLFDDLPHKGYWYVSFFGDKQGVLCSPDGSVVRFGSKSEAEQFCMENWPDLKYLSHS